MMDTSTRTSPYADFAAGACSYDGSAFYLTTLDSGSLVFIRFATTAVEVPLVGGSGYGAWGGGALPGSCHVRSGRLFVGVSSASPALGGSNRSSLWTPTPAMPVEVDAGAGTSWAQLASFDGPILAGFDLSPSAMTVYAALTGVGVASCGRSGAGPLQPFEGPCQYNTAVPGVVDVLLDLTGLRLFVL